MKLNIVFKFALTVILLVYIVILSIHWTYNKKNIFYTVDLNECYFPKDYVIGINPAENKFYRFFQYGFYYLPLKVHNDSNKDLDNVVLKAPFDGYYQVDTISYKINHEISIAKIPAKKTWYLPMWTKAEISRDELDQFYIRDGNGNKIEYWGGITEYSGMYFWILENRDTWEFIILPGSFILVFIVGLLLGRWTTISIQIN